MKKMIQYLKELGASKCTLVSGPNGRFVRYTIGTEQSTLPVGKKSQNGTLEEFNVLITEDGTAIATVNHYEDVQEVELV